MIMKRKLGAIIATALCFILTAVSVYADDARLSEHHTAVSDFEGHSASGPDKRPDRDAGRSDPGVCGDQRLRAYVFSAEFLPKPAGFSV